MYRQSGSWRAVAAGLCALQCATAGCASGTGKQHQPWTPPPRAEWRDLSTQSVEPAMNGHHILLKQPTKGLFPASMAVTRLAVCGSQNGEETRGPVLLADPRNEYLQWNRALDDKMAVSEVFPIFPRDLAGNPATPDQILRAFRALHARIGLVFAVNEFSESEAEMLGVLFDVRAGQPIATIHARAQSIPEKEAPEAERQNIWKTDAQALVRADFEKSLRDAVRTLISTDQPPEKETTEGWQPIWPTLPVDWPPRDARGYP